MAKISFSPKAKNDLTEIGDYIAFQLHNKSATRNVITKIRNSIYGLKDFPESGTPLTYFDVTYRYLVCGSYMIFYHLSDNNIFIDRILYGRRDYLNILFGDKLSEEIEPE